MSGLGIVPGFSAWSEQDRRARIQFGRLKSPAEMNVPLHVRRVCEFQLDRVVRSLHPDWRSDLGVVLEQHHVTEPRPLTLPERSRLDGLAEIGRAPKRFLDPVVEVVPERSNLGLEFEGDGELSVPNDGRSESFSARK